MKPIRILIVAVALVAAALASTSPAAAEQPFDRCPADLDAWASVPGPVACDGAWSVERIFPAGTRCAFEVVVDYDVTARIYHYDNPERTVVHQVENGTATANGKTLVRVARYTETASSPIVFTDHGLKGRYSMPDGGTLTILAGYSRDSEDPPLPEVFHGNPFDDLDVAAFCAALT